MGTGTAPRSITGMRPRRAAAGESPSVGGTESPDGMPAPFSGAWLSALEPLVVGIRVPPLSSGDGCVQLVCADGDRVRPWSLEISGGVIVGVSNRMKADASVAIAHSVTVGWRLLGLSVRGFHRLDELVIEQMSEDRWDRHPIPPLDEGAIDLAARNHPSVIVWHERVIDSPLGTLVVSRRLAGGQLRISAASTKAPPSIEGVGSDVAWRDVFAARRSASSAEGPRRRVWRGPERDIGAIRAALLCRRHETELQSHLRATRDDALGDAVMVLRGLRPVLGRDPRWRELWQPSARPAR